MNPADIGPDALRRYGWPLMVAGKFADLGATWYALTTVSWAVESNPLPAMAYGAFGIAGLIILNAVALVIVTVTVEFGAAYLERQDAPELHVALVYLVGYWFPGAFWVLISVVNVNRIQMAQSALGL